MILESCVDWRTVLIKSSWNIMITCKCKKKRNSIQHCHSKHGRTRMLAPRMQPTNQYFQASSQEPLRWATQNTQAGSLANSWKSNVALARVETCKRAKREGTEWVIKRFF